MHPGTLASAQGHLTRSYEGHRPLSMFRQTGFSSVPISHVTSDFSDVLRNVNCVRAVIGMSVLDGRPQRLELLFCRILVSDRTALRISVLPPLEQASPGFFPWRAGQFGKMKVNPAMVAGDWAKPAHETSEGP